VWHCHILDHEDNDMMRPMVITFKDLPSLNSASVINSAPGSPVNASNYPAPATTKPAHDHHGTTPTTEQQMNKGTATPTPTPMPMPEQHLR
jgi:hypothetical protein